MVLCVAAKVLSSSPHLSMSSAGEEEEEKGKSTIPIAPGPEGSSASVSTTPTWLIPTPQSQFSVWPGSAAGQPLSFWPMPTATPSSSTPLLSHQLPMFSAGHPPTALISSAWMPTTMWNTGSLGTTPYEYFLPTGILPAHHPAASVVGIARPGLAGPQYFVPATTATSSFYPQWIPTSSFPTMASMAPPRLAVLPNELSGGGTATAAPEEHQRRLGQQQQQQQQQQQHEHLDDLMTASQSLLHLHNPYSPAANVPYPPGQVRPVPHLHPSMRAAASAGWGLVPVGGQNPVHPPLSHINWHLASTIPAGTAPDTAMVSVAINTNLPGATANTAAALDAQAAAEEEERQQAQGSPTTNGKRKRDEGWPSTPEEVLMMQEEKLESSEFHAAMANSMANSLTFNAPERRAPSVPTSPPLTHHPAGEDKAAAARAPAPVGGLAPVDETTASTLEAASQQRYDSSTTTLAAGPGTPAATTAGNTGKQSALSHPTAVPPAGSEPRSPYSVSVSDSQVSVPSSMRSPIWGVRPASAPAAARGVVPSSRVAALPAPPLVSADTWADNSDAAFALANQIVHRPSPLDVLSGRGHGSANFPGNIRFRTLVREQKAFYQSTIERKIKAVVTWNIIKEILQSGGRFLQSIDDGEGEDEAVVEEGHEDLPLEGVVENVGNNQTLTMPPNQPEQPPTSAVEVPHSLVSDSLSGNPLSPSGTTTSLPRGRWRVMDRKKAWQKTTQALREKDT